MSLKTWERKVLARPGAAERVAALEQHILICQGLVAARKKAKISQTELAHRLGVSQPRVAPSRSPKTSP